MIFLLDMMFFVVNVMLFVFGMLLLLGVPWVDWVRYLSVYLPDHVLGLSGPDWIRYFVLRPLFRGPLYCEVLSHWVAFGVPLWIMYPSVWLLFCGLPFCGYISLWAVLSGSFFVGYLFLKPPFYIQVLPSEGLHRSLGLQLVLPAGPRQGRLPRGPLAEVPRARPRLLRGPLAGRLPARVLHRPVGGQVACVVLLVSAFTRPLTADMGQRGLAPRSRTPPRPKGP